MIRLTTKGALIIAWCILVMPLISKAQDTFHPDAMAQDIIHPDTVYSLLKNINCGGAQATCFQQTTANSGAVRCTCSATCVANQCPNPSVAATRAVQWGTYVTPLGPCIVPVTGTATGGTTVTTNASRITAVFAQVMVSGAIFGTPLSSRQVSDCFLGLYENDPQISAQCI